MRESSDCSSAQVTSLLSSRQHLVGQEPVFVGQGLAFVHELYTMACHGSHLSNCRLMPDLELESVIAAGVGMHRSAHLRQVTVDQHMIRLTRVQENDTLLRLT